MVLSTNANGQLKDFAQFMILSKYNTSQLSTFLKKNSFKYQGEEYLPEVKRNMKIWTYQHPTDNHLEGGVTYFIGQSNKMVFSYSTLDPAFVSSALLETEKYGYTLEKKVEKKDNDISYIYKNKNMTLIIRMWRQNSMRMIVFIIGEYSDIDALNNK